MTNRLVPTSPGLPEERGLDANSMADVSARSAATGHSFERVIASIRRYKWLMLGIVLAGLGGGVAAMQLITPEYEVQATIWIQSETPDDKNAVGPIRSQELLSSIAWVELLKTYRIADAVVRKLSLYVVPEQPEDAPFFRGFDLQDRYIPGQYELVIDGAAGRWSLKSGGGAGSEEGAAADSVGKKFGFKWLLPVRAFARREQREIQFTVETPRETARGLMSDINTGLTPQTNLLRLSYLNADRDIAAQVLNTWATEYVSVAGDLKKRNMVEFSTILEGQLEFSRKALESAERSLEDFRVHTITLPAENAPIAAGLESTRDPALNSYFQQKIAYDDLRHDREAVEKAIANAQGGQVPYEGLLLIPSVSQSPGAKALRDAFEKQYLLTADLTAKRSQFTDAFLKDEIAQLTTLQQQTIPNLANQVLVQLRERERDHERRIAGASKEMQAIPARTIEEMRLRRAVLVAEGLYTNLKARHAEAKLAEAGTSPDVRILDSAVAPSKPTKNTAPKVMAVAILAGAALAFGIALLLDRLDSRFHYSDQAVSELGLPIAGVVPQLPKGGVDSSRSPEQVLQLVESFRSLRMHVIHAIRGPMTLAVSSAAPGDGKSLVAANLAMSFAEAGFRTVLIDADTRRGSLHTMFGATPPVGFTEYILSLSGLDDIVVPTGHDKLSLIACGRRHHRSPEFLTSPRVMELVTHLSSKFDVVIFDTPPLAAGIDAYAISAAVRNLLMVVRIGATQRRLASAKLSVVDRLPINLIGTVLNGVELKGEFQYYGYTSGYGIEELQEIGPGAQNA